MNKLSLFTFYILFFEPVLGFLITLSGYCVPSRLSRQYSLVSQYSQQHVTLLHTLPDVWWETNQAQLLSNNFSSFKTQKSLRFVKFPSGSVFFHLWHRGDEASCFHQELLVKPEQFLIRSWIAGESQTRPSPAVASCVCGLWCFCGLQNLDLRMGSWSAKGLGDPSKILEPILGKVGTSPPVLHPKPSNTIPLPVCKHRWAPLLWSQFVAAGYLAHAVFVLAYVISVVHFLFV